VLATATTSPWVRVPLVTVVALAVQLSFFTDMRPFDAVADIMLLLVLAGGMVAGPRDGALCGFGIGIAYDLMLRTPFGLSALTYAIVGYAAGYLQGLVSAAPWWAAMLVMGAASSVSVAAYAVIGTIFGLKDAVSFHLLTVMGVVGVVNLLLAVPALWVQRWALLGRESRANR
jgi:rod shape-determining protein MreD